MTEGLSIRGFALAGGVLWGLCILFAGWMASFGWSVNFVSAFNFYIGYGPTFLGGIIGGIEGFIDGAVAGAVLAFVYNWASLPKRRHR